MSFLKSCLCFKSDNVRKIKDKPGAKILNIYLTRNPDMKKSTVTTNVIDNKLIISTGYEMVRIIYDN